jgi:hypothetical protein
VHGSAIYATTIAVAGIASGGAWAGYFNGPLVNSNVGGSGEHDVCANGNGQLVNCGSDGRLKRDVAPLTEEIDVTAVVQRLRGVAFSWDTSHERAESLGDGRQIGLIAQEVEAVLPQVVSTGGDGYQTVDYAKLTALLIEVAKAQHARIDELQRRLEAVEAR